MSYTRVIPIEFNHCDPAGIVFYPRYFEMANSVVENFFGDVLDYPFARITLQEGHSVPTVRLEADFRAPSRLGDRVEFVLEVRRLGRSSVDLRITGAAGGETRLVVALTLVWVGTRGRAESWPDALRQSLQANLSPDGEAP
jgi:4-hydroxybenzoyl-CoA thioesterase